jgi:hypothetical protein
MYLPGNTIDPGEQTHPQIQRFLKGDNKWITAHPKFICQNLLTELVSKAAGGEVAFASELEEDLREEILKLKKASKSLKKATKKAKANGDAWEWKQDDLLTIRNAEASFLLFILLDSPFITKLIEEEGDLSIFTDMVGRTPLHYAAKAGNTLATKLLMAALPGEWAPSAVVSPDPYVHNLVPATFHAWIPS